VRFLNHTADVKTWFVNLTNFHERQYFSRNVLNVFGRATQRLHNKFVGKTSMNFDVNVSFQVDAMKDWLFKYYKLESITITNNSTHIYNKAFYGVNDIRPEGFQQTNIGGVDDYVTNILPFNMYGVDDTVTPNVYSVSFTITGRLSDKQKADITKFILLRTQKTAETNFLDPTGGDIIVWVYLKGDTQRIVDIEISVDESKNVFINGLLETDPQITDTFFIKKINSMDKVTFTGNGVSKTFSTTNTLLSTDIVAQARIQSTGQVVEADITVSETTISIDTGAVAISNGVKLDVLITSN
jgi:hypothetical protein